MCNIKWAPPNDRFDLELGFALPQPTYARVAAQALLMTLEAVERAPFIDPTLADVAVGTKNKLIYDILADPNKAKTWQQTGRWPKGHASLRALLCKCLTMLEAMSSYVTLVFIEREAGDDPIVDLDKHRTKDGFDFQGLQKQGASAQEIEKALQETRMRGVMAQKLMASNARCFRPRKK